MSLKKAGKMEALPKRFGRVSGGLGIAAAMVVVLLFVGSAAAAPAISAASTVTYKAPYSGAAYGTINDYSTGCGVAMSAPVLPVMNLTSGYAFESVKASARSCGGQNGTGNVQAVESFFSSTFNATTKGLHRWTSEWVANFSVKLKATPGGPTQPAMAGFAVNANFQLIDTTNGSEFFPSTVPIVELYISTGTYSHSYAHLHQVVQLNVTLAKGHTYLFIAEMSIYVYVAVSPGASTASASVNMGSNGRNAFLESVIER